MHFRKNRTEEPVKNFQHINHLTMQSAWAVASVFNTGSAVVRVARITKTDPGEPGGPGRGKNP
jgi:hypothetical protein